ncbi:hypothetical protein MTBUT4_170015 [Magnetospirillum sp. UT-4]|nr:hypothetical protein MTBUT4_170015 [Magnetospirillum sp. UT-4]
MPASKAALGHGSAHSPNEIRGRASTTGGRVISVGGRGVTVEGLKAANKGWLPKYMGHGMSGDASQVASLLKPPPPRASRKGKGRKLGPMRLDPGSHVLAAPRGSPGRVRR